MANTQNQAKSKSKKKKKKKKKMKIVLPLVACKQTYTKLVPVAVGKYSIQSLTVIYPTHKSKYEEEKSNTIPVRVKSKQYCHRILTTVSNVM